MVIDPTMLNHMTLRADVAVIGGGILGLAHAYVLARRSFGLSERTANIMV